MRAAMALAVAVACGGSGAPDAGPGGFVPIVPGETADSAALAHLTDWRSLPTLGGGAYRMQSSRDRGTGDTYEIALLEHGNRDMNNFVCRGRDAFSYGNGLVPFVFDLESCPEEYVKGYVLSRFEGSGRLARLQMTMLSIAEGDPPLAVLRIYVDDREEPFVQVRLADALDGSAGEIFAPPFGKGDPTHLRSGSTASSRCRGPGPRTT